MKTPTKERFAAALAKTIYERHRLAGRPGARTGRGRSSAACGSRPRWRSTRATARCASRFQRRHAARPTSTTRSSGCSSCPASSAAERKRRVVIVFDEFQEILALDPALPEPDARRLPGPAGGEPRLPRQQAAHPRARSSTTERAVLAQRQAARDRADPAGARSPGSSATDSQAPAEGIDADALDAAARGVTRGHPYGTQELAYFVWELVPPRRGARRADVEAALGRVLRSEHNTFARIWEPRPGTSGSSCSRSRRSRSTCTRKRRATASACRRRRSCSGPFERSSGRTW